MVHFMGQLGELFRMRFSSVNFKRQIVLPNVVDLMLSLEVLHRMSLTSPEQRKLLQQMRLQTASEHWLPWWPTCSPSPSSMSQFLIAHLSIDSFIIYLVHLSTCHLWIYLSCVHPHISFWFCFSEEFKYTAKWESRRPCSAIFYSSARWENQMPIKRDLHKAGAYFMMATHKQQSLWIPILVPCLTVASTNLVYCRESVEAGGSQHMHCSEFSPAPLQAILKVQAWGEVSGTQWPSPQW